MSFKSEMRELGNHLQTGVSYMIPVVTAGGLLMSIGTLVGGTNVAANSFWGQVKNLGLIGLQFIPIVIAAYIAFSIADRPGLAPGFIVGIVAQKMGTGFIGGIVVGLLVGYLTKWLKKVPVPQKLVTVKALLFIPLIVTAIIGLLYIYIIDTPLKAVVDGLTGWLQGMKGANSVFLAAILGAMMAFDMGGPVNKVAYTFGMGCYAQGVYAPSTAMLLAISIPPFIMFVATLFDKSLYSKEEIENGRTAAIMGIFGITEGTIPFALADPLRVIPSIMVGTAVSCALNAAFGVTQKTAMTTLMALPFASNIILYIVSIVVGVLVGAVMVTALKKFTHHNVDQDALK